MTKNKLRLNRPAASAPARAAFRWASRPVCSQSGRNDGECLDHESGVKYGDLARAEQEKWNERNEEQRLVAVGGCEPAVKAASVATGDVVRDVQVIKVIIGEIPRGEISRGQQDDVDPKREPQEDRSQRDPLPFHSL
jgi:hypothetical protein